MRAQRRASGVVAAVAAAVTLFAPGDARAQAQQASPFKGDFLARQEWTEDIFTKPDQTPASRRRFRVRPRMEIESASLRLVVGAELNYSSDTNIEPDDVTLPLRLIRDNYDSRGIRLDLASLGITLGGNLRVEGGRMAMPLRVTEMLWDRDLRVQGGSASWSYVSETTGRDIVRLGAVYSRGGHVFVDSEKTEGSSLGEGATLQGGSIDLGFGNTKRFELTGSYFKFDKLEHLELMIRRQNTRANNLLAREFGVIDVVGRFRWEATPPVEVIVDYAVNHKAETQRTGLWAALAVGSVRDGRMRGEYTYARMDRDVTVAAYAGDDFFWATGWDGHRVDLGFSTSPQSSFHIVGQLQRFKDGPAAEQNHWVKRLRLEARRSF
jgi:hypothetical protein